MTTIFRLITVVTLAAAAVVGGSASAQKMTNEGLPPPDPLIEEAQWDAPRNTFFLNGGRDVELIRFKSVHDIELCAGRGDPDAIGGTRHGYPIQVSWDADVGIIMPGNCLTFDAMRVKVKPASPLPQDVELVGTVKVLR